MVTAKVRAPTLQEITKQLTDALRRTGVNPSIFGYKPQAHQIPFHQSTKQGKLFLGGNRVGKTVAGGAEMVYRLTGTHPYRAVPEPPIRARAIGSDFIDGIGRIILPEIARWMPPSFLKNGSWEDSYVLGTKTLELTNGSFLEFMSYDQDVQKFAGTSRHCIWFDEEPPEDIFNENMLRLVDTAGDWWLTMTPLIDMSWTYDRLFETGLKGGVLTLEDGIEVSTLELFQATVFQNEYINAQQVAILTQGLGDEEKLARIQGKYFSYVGAIYSKYMNEDNWIPAIHTSENWPIYFAKWGHFGMLDVGLTNPTAFYIGCFNEEGQVIIYFEYYEAGRLASENAQAIKKILKDLRLYDKLEYIIADPHAWDKNAVTGTSPATEYAEEGLYLGKANNEVTSGINRVAQRLKARSKNKKPMLMLTDNCEKAKWEFARYRWARYDTSKAANKNNAKETPQKKDDHAMDAIRYGIVSRPQLDWEKPIPRGNVLDYPVAVSNDGWSEEVESTSESEYFDEFLGTDW